MTITTIEVRRQNFGETRIVSNPVPELKDGEILASIDRFALTANNVTYAVAGDMVGYWKFFPAAEPWGVVPVWGFADIIASRHPDVPVGERIWGFLPMSSHLVLSPQQVRATAFVDGAAHRASLPPLYNSYQRTSGDPPEMKALENERCILFPLFSTSFILCDYLSDNAFFGARQILVGSASSKTGLGLTNLLSRLGADRPRIVGLTSPRNLDFVRSLGTCDDVLTYDQIAGMDGSVPTAFVDMSGDGTVVSATHQKFDANLKLSCAVGITHWNTGRFSNEGVSSPHTFFFAPSQFLKREKDWGPGESLRRAGRESARMALEMRSRLHISHKTGPDAVAAAWRSLVDNAIPPTEAIMASLRA